MTATTLGEDRMSQLAAASGLTVRACGRWPETSDDNGDPPPLVGFITSTFSPLVAAAAERCLRSRYGEPPAEPSRGVRTAVMLASRHGDRATAEAVAAAVDAGRPAPPLLFFQSVPNAVLGHIARRWNLRGPVLCISPHDDPLSAGVAAAELLICDGDADEALLVVADQSQERDERDSAVALLVGPGEGAR